MHAAEWLHQKEELLGIIIIIIIQVAENEKMCYFTLKKKVIVSVNAWVRYQFLPSLQKDFTCGFKPCRT